MIQHTIIDRLNEDGERISGSLFTLAAVVYPGIGGRRSHWAAYRDDPQRPMTIEMTAAGGDKLPEAVARFFFPGIEERYRG